jgi:hypothetical protein
MPSDLAKRIFHNALDRPFARLSLKTKKLSAVVDENNLVTCHYVKQPVGEDIHRLPND